MEKPDENEQKIEFERVLNQELGEFGLYQFRNILLVLLPAIFSGFMAGDYIFTAGRLPHRCAVPICDDRQQEYAPNWILDVIPETATGFDDCSRYANITQIPESILNGTCPANLFDRNNIISCESYVYERTNTVVYDFGLECQEWLRALSGTLNSMGAMIALPLAGFISDVFGRRMSVVFFGFNVALVGCVRAFSVNYAMYATLQFMHTAIGGGLYSAGYILATEIVGPRFRIYTSATMSSTFALGQALLGLIASAVLEWRTLSLVLFAPVFLLISYYWILMESHRWLLSKNKTDEAKATLLRAAKLNRKEIQESHLNFLLTAIPKQNKSNTGEKNLVYRVLKSRVMLRRCCTTPVYWITTTFIYYGLSINAVSLSGNMYLNYILVSLIEIPGYWTAVLVLDRVGRKATLFSGYLLCGICCFAFAFTPKSLYGISLFLYLLGKYCTGVVFTSLYLFTTELYPTRHRHSFLGFSSMMGRIGSIVAPLTPPLMVYWSGIPSVLFGGMAVMTAFLILTQPETRGRKIPDTFEEAENIK
ncbi:organic cation transporter protein [Papilio machaon]|uniref:organic cation transporter protein n=1 Tax=Papilio machaon TaxID=76193 RepID=UPI001E663DB4|nr:organic cation transporter protein [Papilio machaon]